MRLEEFSELKVLKHTNDKKISLVWNEILQCCFIKKQFRKYAKREVYQKLQSYDHPHIVRVYAIFENYDELIVIEEYLNGTLLKDELQRAETSTKLKWFYEICEGVQVLHKENMIYRDIKPENIMIIRNCAILFDFDIAKQLYTTYGQTTMIGTTGYASPEQYGFSKTDKRSDIYALGILLNELIVGKHPKEELASEPYKDIIKTCTALDPNQRYQSIEEVMYCLNKPIKQRKKRLDWIDGIILLIALFCFFTLESNKLVPFYELLLMRLSISMSILYILAIRVGYVPLLLKNILLKIPKWTHWLIYVLWWFTVFIGCIILGSLLTILISSMTNDIFHVTI